MTPYYETDDVTLWHGDCRELLPLLGQRYDACVADPPYGETSLTWDRWPDGWPAIVATVTSSLWCFGSMRMILDHASEFAGWRLSQDVVWEKRNGTGFAADRFKRVHELATHWYLGPWSDIHHQVPRNPAVYDAKGRDKSVSRSSTPHTGTIGAHRYEDDGLRLTRSVIQAPSVRRGRHRTQKPVRVLDPLIRYAVPDGGTVLDPFAGSGSTAVAARLTGRRAVLIEADERCAEKAARRLDQGVLTIEGSA